MSNRTCPGARIGDGASTPSHMRRLLVALFSLLACGPDVDSMQGGSNSEEARLQADDDLQKSVSESLCLPPTPAEIASAKESLRDFTVIRGEPHQLVVTFPSEAELDDLAYFVAAVAEEATAAQMFDSPMYGRLSDFDADPSPARRLIATSANSKSASSSGTGLLLHGRPGTLPSTATEEDGEEEDEDLEQEDDEKQSTDEQDQQELQTQVWRLFGKGDCASAARLYWKVYPPANSRERFIRTRILCEEKAHHCRGAVSARLASVDSPATDTDNIYGPQRLAAAGFDLHRLYRGAWLTAYRDMKQWPLQALFLRSPKSIKEAALRRFSHKGPEAWEFQVRALEGLNDLEKKQAVPRLMGLLNVWLLPQEYPSTDSPIVRAIQTLSSLVIRREKNPCWANADVTQTMSEVLENNSSRRSILTLSKCGEVLDAAEQEQLAAQVIPELKSSLALQADAHTHFESLLSILLANIGAIGSVPALREVLGEATGIEQRACDNVTDDILLDRGQPISCTRARSWRADVADTIDIIEEVEREWQSP